MRLHVDRTRCCGYGRCIEIAPHLFDIDETGYATVLCEFVAEELVLTARKAAKACPARAIEVLEDGTS